MLNIFYKKNYLWQTILHDFYLFIFSNEYYGGLWATFNFDGLQKWIEDLKTVKNNTRNTNVDLESGEKFFKASDQYSTVENIEETWYIFK